MANDKTTCRLKPKSFWEKSETWQGYLYWYDITYIQVGSISLTFLQSREIEGSPVRWTSEIQCAKDMISMKSLTFSSHASGAKVRHQGPPGTAEAQPLIIIIISFKITIHGTVFSTSWFTNTKIINGKSQHHKNKLGPLFPHGTMIWETGDEENFKPQQLCTQQVYWVLYVIVQYILTLRWYSWSRPYHANYLKKTDSY